MRAYCIVFAAFLALGECVIECRAQEANVDLETLKAVADEVAKFSNLDARNKVKAVFDYADALARAGRDKEALGYYDRGLQIHAWSLPNQLRYAQLLMKTGSKDLAVERARLVAENAEQDALVAPALVLLGREAEANMSLPPLAKIDANGPALVLVAMGEADALLIKEVRARLQKELPLPVFIQQANVTFPAPDRIPLKEYLAGIRRVFLKDPGDQRVAAALEDLKLTRDNLNDDEQFRLFARELLIKNAGKGQADEFEAACRKLVEQDSQWKAETLLDVLRGTIKPYECKHVRYLGLTRLDIYTEGANYLFALQGGNSGVVSYRRFMYDKWDEEVPKRGRLIERFAKQCCSSTGRLFGVGTCSNPTCVAAYPNSVEELDAKGMKFCPSCLKVLEQALEQERKP